MTKKLLNELKEKLKKQKAEIESQLKKFAVEDKKLKGDWDTKYPKADSGVGSQALEDAADQVEEYVTLLPLEHNLELRLQSVNKALEKINLPAGRQGKGRYGKCGKCGKNISEERLKVYPEAKLCRFCERK